MKILHFVKANKIWFVVALSGIMIFFLFNVLSGRLILPQALNLGLFQIRFYGIIIAFAVMVGYFFAIRRSPKYGLSNNEADSIIFWVLVLGFVGARLYHVATDWSFYRDNLVSIAQVWHGGLSIYGVLIGGIVGLLLSRKVLRVKVARLKLLDWLAPSLLIGQIIGRFGNLFNYELFGYPTNLLWKMFVPTVFRPMQYMDSQYFQPLFLYEAVGNVVILILLLKIENKTLKPARLFFSYVLMYNTLRFALEFLRIDSPYLYGFRINALLSLALAIIALFFLVYKHDITKPQSS